ncbi:hypothetical protein F4806DRAFT_452873 [Annulohypoxylon nitens]|nr:hypothetical protein F4806DRAFT_452873 [Annulohypoxylon nitens]
MTEEAKQKFLKGVEKTRAPAGDEPTQGGIKVQSTSGGDNPKAGGSSFRPIAKGETNSSNYVPAKGPST